MSKLTQLQEDVQVLESQCSSRPLTNATSELVSSLLTYCSSYVWPKTNVLPKDNPSQIKSLLSSRIQPCVSCHLDKKLCTCAECEVCHGVIRRGTRHHCRCCWRPVCNKCWTRLRHTSFLQERVQVCDTCAIPWALANLPQRKCNKLFWGLYILCRAVDMPCLCIDPSCRTYTYQARCYACSCPTVMTQPHLPRVVGPDVLYPSSVSRVSLLDFFLCSQRRKMVDSYSLDEVEHCFRTYFRNFEDASSFEGVTSTQQAQDILLGLVCTGISYEYNRAPNISLALSDIPYARLLKINSSHPRYTIMEAPGKVKFISFPGTHDWRTFWINFNTTQITKTKWAPLVDGIAAPPTGFDNDAKRHLPIYVSASLCKVWEYKVHAGFAQEARQVGFSLDSLAEDLDNDYRLVLTGHSLGGAVAQLLTLQLLEQYPTLHGEAAAGRPIRILCITVGAPLIGDDRLAKHIYCCGWSRYFHNFVYRSDIVPRLGCGNELTWEMGGRVLGQVSQFCSNLRNWFALKKKSTEVVESVQGRSDKDKVSRTVCKLDLSLDDAEGEAEFSVFDEGEGDLCNASNLVEYVDKTIRGECHVRAEQEDLPHKFTGMVVKVNPVKGRPRRCDSASQPLATTERRVNCNGDDIGDSAKATNEGERVPGRYACFGRYHFGGYCDRDYTSTSDPEQAFALLKRGCEADVIDLQDHSIASYNRFVMLRLCGKRMDA